MDYVKCVTYDYEVYLPTMESMCRHIENDYEVILLPQYESTPEWSSAYDEIVMIKHNDILRQIQPYHYIYSNMEEGYTIEVTKVGESKEVLDWEDLDPFFNTEFSYHVAMYNSHTNRFDFFDEVSYSRFTSASEIDIFETGEENIIRDVQ